ncbi:MAG: hypothetical protein KKD17_02485 [Nanoarchaeota archaeon]|nr:hypothetical protein [Nanoarchaeota archaeon]
MSNQTDVYTPNVEAQSYVPIKADDGKIKYAPRDTFWDMAEDALPDKPNRPLPWYWQN